MQRCRRGQQSLRTILWKFLEPQPKSSVVSPEFMEKVGTPAFARTWRAEGACRHDYEKGYSGPMMF